MTVSERFFTLLGRTNLTEKDVEQFAGHKATVKRRLETVFPSSTIVQMGSQTRGSEVRGSSDIDLLLSMPRESVRWGDKYKRSDTVLTEVRQQLEARYTQTAVDRDGQAIAISFGGGQYIIEVVPGFYWEPDANNNNYPTYYIPDGGGGWMKTGPQTHNKFIAEADARSGGKLKNVAKLLKWWRVCRTPNVALNSFHVELLLAQEGTCAGVKSYQRCLRDVFVMLFRRECRGLQDPCGVAGLVKACDTEPKREKTQASVNDSAWYAQQAIEAEDAGKITDAYQRWDQTFNGQFPKS